MKSVLERLLRGEDLSEQEAGSLLGRLTDPDTSAVMSAGLLTALRAKGASPAEVRGLAAAMLAQAIPVQPARAASAAAAVDIVGTGGDGSGSLNLSTGAALLAAASGIPVIKHGNRSVSSRCGSADVLEALGYELPSDPTVASEDLERTGFSFLFAPHFHPAMKSLAAVRRDLGVRTVFNILGPLTNPASPPFSVIGAFSARTAALMADALSGMPIRRAFVIHGENGWDEATPIAPFTCHDVRPGTVSVSIRDAQEIGLPRCTEADLAGGDVADNAQAIRDAFSGQFGPHRDALVLGAALALEVSGQVDDGRQGRARAEAALDSGAAARLIDSLARRALPERARG
ncbi:MAG: anthranilate phosphoribosyltransferase [Gemmatimonadota bacterium]